MNGSDGVSVVVCCYNSAHLIAETLYCLINQNIRQGIFWEIVLVDNNCTDKTVTISKKILGKSEVDWKIVNEKNPGLIYAREKGIQESKYEYIIFCDDDNRLSCSYVETAYDTMSSDYSIGACGGIGEADIECEKPEWFDLVSPAYALGGQNRDGKTTYLYGAGVCFRRSILDELYHKRCFKPYCVGRKGDLLLAGDDSELTFAIRLMGFSLKYNSALTFKHKIATKRLKIEYVERMFFGFGYSYPVLCVYESVLGDLKTKWVFINYFIFVLKSIIKLNFLENKPRIRTMFIKGFIFGLKNYIKEIKKIKEMVISIKKSVK